MLSVLAGHTSYSSQGPVVTQHGGSEGRNADTDIMLQGRFGRGTNAIFSLAWGRFGVLALLNAGATDSWSYRGSDNNVDDI